MPECGNSKYKTDSIKNVALASSIQTGDRCEFRIPVTHSLTVNSITGGGEEIIDSITIQQSLFGWHMI